MNAAIYYTLFPLIWLLSLLPYTLLYLISDFFYFLVYYVIGYRKKVVRNNLENSFPGLSVQKYVEMEKKFYRHFCDVILETLKLINISENSIKKRCPFSQQATELFNTLYDSNKQVIIAMGHYGNWEMAGVSMNCNFNYRVQVVYKPLKNKYFDSLIYGLRSRFGAVPVPMNIILKELFQKKEELAVTAFIADQSPSPDHAQWLNFLHQETPVFTGVEKIATKLNYPVVFASVRKIKRGFYETDVKLLTDNPSQHKPGEITSLFMNALQDEIIRAPEFWLWSHKRWKHKRKSLLKTEQSNTQLSSGLM
ncbi:MAG: lysophospholipid acyltransferase family protein [Bacteroidota bacterium]|nr:lysophospholipid acyltransferase family protein [Bacteroidota bacterium]